MADVAGKLLEPASWPPVPEVVDERVAVLPAGSRLRIFYQMEGWDAGASAWRRWQSPTAPDLTGARSGFVGLTSIAWTAYQYSP